MCPFSWQALAEAVALVAFVVEDFGWRAGTDSPGGTSPHSEPSWVAHFSPAISSSSAAAMFQKGVSSSKILNYMNAHLMPAFDKFPEERKLDLLKNLAGSSPYAMTQDSCQLLPSIVQLLKTPNSTNSLFGYKIVTGQPSDRLGGDFSENYKDFTERLNATEEIVRDAMEKLTRGMGESNKAFVAAKTKEEKSNIGKEQHKLLCLLKMCLNILSMTQPLHSNVTLFIGEDDTISLSWYPVKLLPGPATAGDKRDAPPGAYTPFPKRGCGEGGLLNHNVNRGFEGLNRGGSQWRGRGWGNRGRGRGF